MSNNKMKGLLKGLRYISQIFDNEKEPEMQIGYPTDVKHVAHIGWDGPSVNSPSWMNGFKSGGDSFTSSSAPLNSRGEPRDEDAIQWASGGKSGGIISRSRGLDGDIAEVPKSSRRHSSSGGLAGDSPKKEKSKQKRSSKTGDGKSTRLKDSTESSSSPPVLPKSRRKKSVSKTSRSKTNNSDVDCGSDCGSVSNCGSNLSALEDDVENGFIGIS